MSASIGVAVAQPELSRDVARNGTAIRSLAERAAAEGADLVVFPEGALSGYVKAQIRTWHDVDWSEVAAEREAIADLATSLGVVLIVGSAHKGEAARPYNSVHVLGPWPDCQQDRQQDRYDMRFLSYSEVSDWYTPGAAPLIGACNGYRFGVTVCIEMQFPELYQQYEALGVDLVAHPTYGLGEAGDTILRAHAATNCLWLAVALPAQATGHGTSGIVGPDGCWMTRCDAGEGYAVARLDRGDERFDIALNKARPWRRLARQGGIYRQALVGSKSSDTPLMQ